MIEILILNELNKNILTMYGISKRIKTFFPALTNPSFGTIKPALLRLQKYGFVNAKKDISEGGRPSVYYSVTKDGIEYLKTLLLKDPSENPNLFLTNSRIKLVCSGILDDKNKMIFLDLLKSKAECIKTDALNVLTSKNPDFYCKMTYDNLVCEYNNFISLLEGLKNGCKG